MTTLTATRSPRGSAPVRGRIAVTHTWMERDEAELALRRLELFTLGDDVSAYVLDVTRPGGERAGWLAVARGDEVLHRSASLVVREQGEIPGGGDSTYPIPATVRIKSEKLTIALGLERPLLRHDPLEVMPQPFHFLLALTMSPLRVWTNSTFEVTLPASEPNPLEIEGTGVTAVTFLNPPDR